MEYLKRLSKREKILLLILLLLISELLIYYTIFSKRIININNTKYEIENLKLLKEKNEIESKKVKIVSNDDVKIDIDGFLKEFPDSILTNSSDNQRIELEIKKEDVAKLSYFSKFLTYHHADIEQNETGYLITLNIENKGIAVLPTILASNENIKEKYISNNTKPKIEQTSKNVSKNIAEKSGKLTDTKSSKNADIVLKETKNVDEKVISQSNFPIDFQNIVMKPNIPIQSLLMPMENGFMLYVNSETTFKIKATEDMQEKISNVRVKVNSPKKTSALLKIEDEYYQIKNGDNIFEVPEFDINTFEIMFDSAEENLFSFEFEEIK